MSKLFTENLFAEFIVQSLLSHWFVAIVLVALVALFVTSMKSLNATTRHNIWLITLISFILMPLLVFVPKPSVNVNLLDFFTSQNVEQISSVPVRVDTQSRVLNEKSINTKNTASTDRTSFTPSVLESQSSEFKAPVVNTVEATKWNFISVMKGIFVFWAVGSLYFIRRLWGEYRAARELELQSDSVTPYFERRFADLCKRLGIEEKPLLRFHAGINAPMTVGLVRVWVAIPMVWREEIDDDVFDQTLTHELGHIARKDPLVNTIQRLLNILFWMYPAVWYVSRQLELERESACDDWVLTHDGKGHTYANNLLSVAESLYLQPHVLAVGCLRSHSQLSRRIQNLLNKSSDHAVKNSWKLLAATATGLLVTLSASAVIWPTAPANATVEVSAKNSGSSKAEPDTQINFSDNGMQILLNGVEVPHSDAQIVHDPRVAPIAPIPPVSPKVISNYGANSHNYSHSEDDETSINRIQSNGGKYGNGSLSITREKGKEVEVKVKPTIKASRSPFLHAAWNNDFSEVKRLLKKGKDINTVYKRPTMPRSALNAAILQGNLEMVEFLHAAGADINTRNSKWNEKKSANALSAAAMVGNKPITKYLLKQGAEADDSTMIIAVQSKNPDLVEFLLKQDVEVNEDALVVAVQNRDQEMIDVLIKHDVEVSDSAVIVAVQNGDKKIVKRLLKETKSIDDSALIIAIQNRDEDMVDWLLDAGADADEGAIIMAVQNRDKKLVKRLIDAGADPDDGALVIAIQSGDEDMVDWLLDAGAEPDDGALVIAVQNRNKPLVKRLLKAGADIDGGALIIALQSRDTEMVQWLLDAGADADDGALIVAIQSGQTKIAKQLLDAGADIDDGALIVAIQSRDRKMVEWLIDAGAVVEDGALIVAMQSGDKRIIELIQKEYKGEINPDEKNYDWDEFESLEALEAFATLENLKSLEKLGDFEKLGKISEKFGEKLGEEIALGVVNFIGDMSENGGNTESIALVKALEMEDIKLAYDLLNDGAIPNTLHITQALELDNAKLARKFLDKGAVPSALNILQALENEETELAKYLMKKGAKPNGIVLLKAMEAEDKALINLVRSYMNENRSEINNQKRNISLPSSQYSSNNLNQVLEHDEEACPHEHGNLQILKWPVNAKKISANFGVDMYKLGAKGKKYHKGLDFPMQKGVEIRSVAKGVVKEVNFVNGYGKYIVLDHGDGYTTLYANNDNNLVKVGQKIECDQVIAIVGNSGDNSTGPHLHFEVRYKGKAQDPRHFRANSKTSS